MRAQAHVHVCIVPVCVLWALHVRPEPRLCTCVHGAGRGSTMCVHAVRELTVVNASFSSMLRLQCRSCTHTVHPSPGPSVRPTSSFIDCVVISALSRLSAHVNSEKPSVTCFFYARAGGPLAKQMTA